MAYLDCSNIINDIKDRVGLRNFEVGMAVVRVGENPADIAYEKSVIAKMKRLEIECYSFQYPQDITHDKFIEELKKINEDEKVSGILVLAPLPAQIDMDIVKEVIAPNKDLDGINITNIMDVYEKGTKECAPCTPQAAIEVLDYLGLEYEGKNICIIGSGQVVGTPIANILIKKMATVSVCNVFTKNVREFTKNADVVISATGVANLLDETYFDNPNAIVIDIGISMLDGKITGDVQTNVADKVKYVTPVKEGIGTITSYLLALRVVNNFNKAQK